jgi:hypothetical protein
MNCIVYTNNDEFSGSKELSGTTCGGSSGFFYLNYGDSICMDIDQPIILCDYFSIGGMCPTPSVTPSNTPTISVTPSITPTAVFCDQIAIENVGPFSGYSIFTRATNGYVLTGGSPTYKYECSSYFGNNYVVYTSSTSSRLIIYSPVFFGGGPFDKFILWNTLNNTCGTGMPGLSVQDFWNTGFTYNGVIYPEPGIGGSSNTNLIYLNCPPGPTLTTTPSQTATPTQTPSVTPTLTQTQTPSSTIGSTSTQTPSNTQTVTPTNTQTQTNTPTPSVTATLTPTTTPTLTVCPETNNCMEITVTGATEEFFPSIEYNNCYGTLINEAFTTNGTRYRCVQFVSGVAQIFSYTGMPEPTIYGGNCNSFECPGGVVPLTPTPTPTVTQTMTPSTTIGSTPSNTQTQTVTPTNTNTPSMTQTNTPTPSVTLTATTAGIDITNGSLDIQISSVYVNSVVTTVIGGSLPNTTGNGTNLETTQVGVYTVEVNYSAGVAGQKITLTDSDLFSTCQNTSTGSNTMTFTSVKVATYTNVIIDAQDGTC